MKTNTNCEWVRDQLAGYADGWLDQKERDQVSAHLESCPECRTELERDQNLVGAMDSLPMAPSPAKTWEQVRNERSETPFGWAWRLGLVVPALAGVLWAVSLMRPVGRTDSEQTVAGMIDDQAFEQAFLISATAEPGGDPNRLILTMGGQ